MDSKLLSTALMAVIEEFKNVVGENDIHTHTLMIFLYIAQRRPGKVTSPDVIKKFNVSPSVVHRNTKILSTGINDTGKAFHIITVEDDPSDWRRKIYSLTPKGEELVSKLAEKLGGVLHV